MSKSQEYIRPDWIEPFLAEFDRHALQAFRNVDSEAKADGSVVTVLDRKVSEMTQQLLRERFPEMGFISEEESQPYLPGAEMQWVLDPIDGTASFVREFPVWGFGLGLMKARVPVEGCLRFPLLDETYLCTAGRVYLNGREQQPASAPPLRDTHNVLIGSGLHGQMSMEKLKGIKLRNFGSNLYHIAALALGRCEAMISPQAYLWDIVPALPFTRARGYVECYLDGAPFSLDDLFSEDPPSYKLPRPLLIGPQEQVTHILDLVR
ncbi:MAG: hypothetical protein O6934_02020 [SAR324 cluster bacterium]|nr:hypothetical protein [SAR324 cluster bacterium]